MSGRFWAIIGTAIHKVLEHEGEHEFIEESVSHDIEGITVTGRIDNYNMKDGIISDYKSVSVWKIKIADYDDWYKQGMIYAWLLTSQGFSVNKCRFIALIKDHSKREAKRDYLYPQKPIAVYEFAVTHERLMEIEAFIRGKISEYKLLKQLPDDGIPPCSPAERWEKPAKYAVKKDGQKKAVRLFDTLDEAETLAGKLGAGHFVERREGESARCAEYCVCCQFCDFYREHAQDKGESA